MRISSTLALRPPRGTQLAQSCSTVTGRGHPAPQAVADCGLGANHILLAGKRVVKDDCTTRLQLFGKHDQRAVIGQPGGEGAEAFQARHRTQRRAQGLHLEQGDHRIFRQVENLKRWRGVGPRVEPTGDDRGLRRGQGGGPELGLNGAKSDPRLWTPGERTAQAARFMGPFHA